MLKTAISLTVWYCSGFMIVDVIAYVIPANPGNATAAEHSRNNLGKVLYSPIAQFSKPFTINLNADNIYNHYCLLINMKKANSIRGKRSRAAGIRFEAKVRSEMEKMGWTVSKWMNTVDFDKEKSGKLVSAKRKYNPFFKALSIGNGFPDFICLKKASHGHYEVIGLEVKRNGYLDKIEKGMCHWLLENKIFSRILIAKLGKKRGEVEYVDFEKKYGR